jgi:hypothetical protein
MPAAGLKPRRMCFFTNRCEVGPRRAWDALAGRATAKSIAATVIDFCMKRMMLRAPGCHYATCIELNGLVRNSMYLSSE